MMNAETQTGPAVEVADFSLRLVYPFAFSPQEAEERLLRPLAALRLPAVAERLPLGQPLKDKLARKAAEGKALNVWEAGEGRPLTQDLYPHLRRLLRPEAGGRSHGLQMTTAAWQVLEGDYGEFGKGLELQLPKAAGPRLGLADAEALWVPFSSHGGLSTLSPPRIYLSGSGIGVLELEISPAAGFLNEQGCVGAQEFLHAVARLGRNAPPIRWQGSAGSCLLESILAAFLPGLGAGVAEPLVSGRLFSFVALRTAAVMPDDGARELAHRLAHRQTDHYLPTPEAIAEGGFAPFENIFHAMDVEGGALVIGTAEVKDQPVAFFKNFISDRVRIAYWPMALLAYLEFLKLVRLTGAVCRDLNLHEPDAKDLRELDAFRADILGFRLNYRFSQASQIAHHNRYYAAWRGAFGSDRLLDELSADVDEVDDYLSYKLEERSNRTLNLIGIYGFPAVLWASFFQFVLQEIPGWDLLHRVGLWAYLCELAAKVHWLGAAFYLLLVAISILFLTLWRAARESDGRGWRGWLTKVSRRNS